MFIRTTWIRIIRKNIFSLKVDATVIASGKAGSVKADSRFARHVIRAVTAGKDGRADESKVRSSCRNALASAEKLKISSIAFPALGCENAHFPAVASAKIMAQETLRHLRENRSCIKEIIFALEDEKTYKVFIKNVLGYLDYIVNKLKSPFLTVDAIIKMKGGIVLIKRSNPPFGWALPGGFVDYGESLEQAVIRESKEETGLNITDLKQFHTYSDPKRDPRFHTVGTVFTAKARGKPRAGDDAAGARVFSFKEIEGLTFAFDHKKILRDYIRSPKADF